MTSTANKLRIAPKYQRDVYVTWNVSDAWSGKVTENLVDLCMCSTTIELVKIVSPS